MEHDWLVAGNADPVVVASHYDQWAASYDRDLTSWRYEAPTVAAQMLGEWRDVVVPDRQLVVLDVGCGTGLVGRALVEVGISMVDGLDVSAESLQAAGVWGAYRTLIAHDLLTMPFPVESGLYDAAVCVGVLTYLPDTVAVLGEMVRAVRSGGLIVATQRDDLWTPRHMPAVLAQLQRDGRVSSYEWTEPKPYLPDNADFADRIQVRYLSAIVA